MSSSTKRRKEDGQGENWFEGDETIDQINNINYNNNKTIG